MTAPKRHKPRPKAADKPKAKPPKGPEPENLEEDGNKPAGAYHLKKPKWEKFANLVAAGMSPEDAYTASGFTPDRVNAYRLQARPDVDVRIDYLRTTIRVRVEDTLEQAVTKVVVTRQWVLDQLTENAMRAMQAVPVVIGGVPTGEFKYEGNVANRALELLGKEVGMFKDTGQPPADVVDKAKTTADPKIVRDIRAVENAAKLVVVGGRDTKKTGALG